MKPSQSDILAEFTSTHHGTRCFPRNIRRLYTIENWFCANQCTCFLWIIECIRVLYHLHVDDVLIGTPHVVHVQCCEVFAWKQKRLQHVLSLDLTISKYQQSMTPHKHKWNALRTTNIFGMKLSIKLHKPGNTVNVIPIFRRDIFLTDSGELKSRHYMVCHCVCRAKLYLSSVVCTDLGYYD